MQAKGISREVCVFEVKHHFLATDWSDLRGVYPRTHALEYEPKKEDVELVAQAYRENPTNLWLAEEFVVMKMLYEYDRLESVNKLGDTVALRQAYEPAEHVLRRLTTSDHRDAVLLTMRGFVVGEYKDFVTEQRLYREALQLDEQYAEAHWYLGYSKSAQLHDELQQQGLEKTTYANLTDDQKERVRDIITDYGTAIELNPFQPWMRYDLACELARWASTKTEIKEATDALVNAVRLNPKIADSVGEEGYLDSIRDQPSVKALLSNSPPNARSLDDGGE